MQFNIGDLGLGVSSGCVKSHTLLFGTTGKGKSFFSESIKDKALASGSIYADTEKYLSGKGLLPYGHEISRRMALGLYGKLPRGIANKKIFTVSTVSRPKKKIKELRQYVVTANQAILTRELLGEARDALHMQTGIWMTQNQLIKLMEPSGIDKTLEEFCEAETQIRGMLANALSESLLGESWPTYGELNECADSGANDFKIRVNAAAVRSGYVVK